MRRRVRPFSSQCMAIGGAGNENQIDSSDPPNKVRQRPYGRCEMSIGCDMDDPCEFYAESIQRSRKRRTCCETGKPIEIGELYANCRMKFDGAFDVLPQSLKAYHLCRAFGHAIGECAVPFQGLRDVDQFDLIDLARNSAYQGGDHLARCYTDLLGKKSRGDDEDWAWMYEPATDADWDQVYADSCKYAEWSDKNTYGGPARKWEIA